MDAKVFVDTSAWLAYSLKEEPDHMGVKEVLTRFIKDGYTVFTSNDVIDESVTRLITTTNINITKRFISYIKESVKRRSLVQLWTDEQIQAEAFELVTKFSEHKISLTDASTLILLKRFKIESLLTLDSDFVKIGIPVLP